MIRVSVEVREGTALSKATVQAESIREAVSIAKGRYPRHQVRVTFPIDPEDFFVEGPKTGADPDESTQPLHAPLESVR
jgi:hypothetical protein